MDFNYYLEKFQTAESRLNKKLLRKKQMETATGIVLNSVFLKLYKKSWVNASQDPLTSLSRIFFSVWINEAAIQEQKIYYNIHALKLRHLKGYSIQSRKFADEFRNGFQKYIHQWENVSVRFGPLTLMEGWVSSGDNNTEEQITALADNFLKMEHLVDDTLVLFAR